MVVLLALRANYVNEASLVVSLIVAANSPHNYDLSMKRSLVAFPCSHSLLRYRTLFDHNDAVTKRRQDKLNYV